MDGTFIFLSVMLTNTRGALVGISLRLFETARMVVPTALAAMFTLATRVISLRFAIVFHFPNQVISSRLLKIKYLKTQAIKPTMASIHAVKDGILEIDGGVLEGVSLP